MFADKQCPHRIWEDICPLCEEARGNLRHKFDLIKNILSNDGIGSRLKIEQIEKVVKGKK